MPKSKLRGGAKAHKTRVTHRNNTFRGLRKKAQVEYQEMFEKQMEELKVQYQNENGDLEKDIKAKKLTNLLFENGLKMKTNDIGKSLWTKEDGSYDVEKFRIYQDPICEINTMNSDNTTFMNELACLTIL